VARGRKAPQPGLDGSRHGAQLALAVKELAERVAQVDGLDLLGADAGVGERRFDHLAYQVAHIKALALVVAGEIGLVAADNPDTAR